MKVQVLLNAPALLLAMQAAAVCPILPTAPRPAVPDGSTATAEQMHAAQEEVGAYVSAIETYLECRQGRIPAIMHNGMVIRAEKVATDYNDELLKYRSLESEIAQN